MYIHTVFFLFCKNDIYPQAIADKIASNFSGATCWALDMAKLPEPCRKTQLLLLLLIQLLILLLLLIIIMMIIMIIIMRIMINDTTTTTTTTNNQTTYVV